MKLAGVVLVVLVVWLFVGVYFAGWFGVDPPRSPAIARALDALTFRS